MVLSVAMCFTMVPEMAFAEKVETENTAVAEKNLQEENVGDEEVLEKSSAQDVSVYDSTLVQPETVEESSKSEETKINLQETESEVIDSNVDEKEKKENIVVDMQEEESESKVNCEEVCMSASVSTSDDQPEIFLSKNMEVLDGVNSISGVQYVNVIQFSMNGNWLGNNGEINYNLHSEYSSVSFKAGYMSGSERDATMTVYADGTVIDEVTIAYDKVAKTYTYDVIGVKHFRVYFSTDGYDTKKYGIGNMTFTAAGEIGAHTYASDEFYDIYNSGVRTNLTTVTEPFKMGGNTYEKGYKLSMSSNWLGHTGKAGFNFQEHFKKMSFDVGFISGVMGSDITMTIEADDTVVYNEEIIHCSDIPRHIELDLNGVSGLVITFTTTPYDTQTVGIGNIQLESDGTPLGIVMSESKVTLTSTDPQVQVIGNVYPSDAFDRSVTYSSDNNSVAIVSKNGTITGLSSGKANVYAKSTYIDIPGICAVTSKTSALEAKPETAYYGYTGEDVAISCETSNIDTSKEIFWWASDGNVSITSKLVESKKAVKATVSSSVPGDYTVYLYNNSQLYSFDFLVDDKNTTVYSSDYTSDMEDYLQGQGVANVVSYLTNDADYAYVSFMAANENKSGTKWENLITNLAYRGLNGWKDLFTDGAYSDYEQTRKILLGFLEASEVECSIYSKAKTASKLAGSISSAYSYYKNNKALGDFLTNAQVKQLDKVFEGSNLDEMLYEMLNGGTYSSISDALNAAVKGANGTVDMEVYKQISKFCESAEISGALRYISKGISGAGQAFKITSTVVDNVNKFAEFYALETADETYYEMMQYIANHADDKTVASAAEDICGVLDGQMKEYMQYMYSSFMKDMTATMVTEVLNDGIKRYPIASIIKAGFDLGTGVSNLVFNTGSQVELRDSMHVCVVLGDCLSDWVFENQKNFTAYVGTSSAKAYADKFFYSTYMLWMTRKKGESTLQSFIKKCTVYGGFGITDELLTSNKLYALSKMISNTLSSYEDNIFSKDMKSQLMTVSAFCPVNLEVYDRSGKKVVTIYDGKESSGKTQNVTYSCVYSPFTEEYLKIASYPEGEGYTVKIIGNDMGNVDSYISVMSSDGSVSYEGFENVLTKKGKEYTISEQSEGDTVCMVTSSDDSEKLSMKKLTVEKMDEEATGISLSESEISISIGDKRILGVTLSPSNVVMKNIIWESSDENVVKVSAQGTLLAVSGGMAKVTVKVDNVQTSCKVKVVGNLSRDCSMSLSSTEYTYSGEAIKPSVKVTCGAITLKSGIDYTVAYASNTNVGTAKVTVTGKGNYTGTLGKTFSINKAKATIKVKTASKKYKKAIVKKKKQTFSIGASVTGKGKLTYNISKYYGKSKKYLSINKKAGKITVKKGIPKGTYKVKVKISAATSTNYEAVTKTATIKVVVK